MSTVASEILQGMREALAYAKGEADTSRYAVHVPRDIDVKSIRAKLKMTQKGFAQAFGFSLTTVRHWEQKLRRPEGPSRAYLLVISRRPDAVREALLESSLENSPSPTP